MHLKPLPRNMNVQRYPGRRKALADYYAWSYQNREDVLYVDAAVGPLEGTATAAAMTEDARINISASVKTARTDMAEGVALVLAVAHAAADSTITEICTDSQSVENVPVGQTTPFLSPPQTVGPDPVHDLPAELLQVGWRRFWSKREGRPYFFNKLTNESLWEMPRLSTSAQYDPLTDPLGIQGPPTPVDPGTPPGPSHLLLPSPPPTSSPVLLPRADKRRASDDANPAAAKKFVLR
ncbi:hypothetical protein HPB49_021318 [Dermacentor silvarum]|uniref:Uncharacterized protein n=1 Tax=Dermacentor silvarum TaxID=543639 RepID=A0ACB8E2U9_DERSI|nr:hypothetical protein HPB49_021318 [Dermacentor silvarum]